MFNTKGQKQEERVLNWISEPGVTLVQFNKFTTAKPFPSGWVSVKMDIETPKVDAPGFKPQQDARIGGKTATVDFGLFHPENKNESVDNLVKDFGTIATKILGESSDENGDGGTAARDAFDADTAGATTIQEFLEACNEHLTGEMVWLALGGREYKGLDGSLKVALKRRRYGFVASEAEGEGHLDAHDPENKYHFERLAPVTPENQLTAPGIDVPADAGDGDAPF